MKYFTVSHRATWPSVSLSLCYRTLTRSSFNTRSVVKKNHPKFHAHALCAHTRVYKITLVIVEKSCVIVFASPVLIFLWQLESSIKSTRSVWSTHRNISGIFQSIKTKPWISRPGRLHCLLVNQRWRRLRPKALYLPPYLLRVQLLLMDWPQSLYWPAVTQSSHTLSSELHVHRLHTPQTYSKKAYRAKSILKRKKREEKKKQTVTRSAFQIVTQVKVV